jgi:predicted Zn-dependent protease
MSPTGGLRKRGVLALLVLVVVSSCAKNPVTGKRELMLVSEAQEIEMGKQAAAQIPAELGLIDAQQEAIARMVQSAGLEMARASERPNLPWEFHVVDSPVVNAFAIPGGFIYLTRGILAHMNSEAEMAGVLGHEIGHVTARHSARQMSAAQLTNLGLGLSMVFIPEVRPFGDVLSTGLGLLFLKFGRDDESQADEIGVRYASQAGYDASKTAELFGVLARMRDDSGDVLPTWLSTHPDPADRQARILELARRHAPGDGGLVVRENEFKRRLEGLVFGENPREGFMDGNWFKHPELRFQIAFPPGWKVENTRQTLFAGSQEAAFQMTASRSSAASPSAHAARALGGPGIQVGSGRSLSIHEFPAFIVPFRAQTAQSVIDGQAAFIRDGDLMYELYAYTTPDRLPRMSDTFLEVIRSFSRLTDPRALRVQPQRVRLYRTTRAMNAREALLDAGVVPAQLETLALANHLDLTEQLPAGTILKSVTPPATPAATQ